MEAALAESVTERARQQGRRLKALRERTGVSKGRLMDRLYFKTSRAYDLYEEGTSVIRTDRLADWAEAFGISEQAFVDAVLQPSPLVESADDPSWDFAAELRAAWPENPAYTQQTYERYRNESRQEQRITVDLVRDLAEQERQDCRPSRAAELRADYRLESQAG